MIPFGADTARFILADGKAEQKPVAKRVLSLVELIETYKTDFTTGAKEANTRKTEEYHFKHITRILGNQPVTDINAQAIQGYVNFRAQETFRKQKIKPQTIRKEIGTLQSVFSWAAHLGLIVSTFSNRRIVFPKSREKLPFQTYAQINEIVTRGGLSTITERSLWDGLFLNTDEVKEVLQFVKDNTSHHWLYAILATAAHTGARRSELIRSQVEDFQFGANTILIREKKKSKSKETFRVVDMSKPLAEIMRVYFAAHHPGGSYTFASDTDQMLKSHQANEAFRWLFRNSKWKVLRGFHAFRHSFASNLSAAGVDQRIIDELMGHQTESMRKRYAHMFPEVRKKAIEAVYG